MRTIRQNFERTYTHRIKISHHDFHACFSSKQIKVFEDLGRDAQLDGMEDIKDGLDTMLFETRVENEAAKRQAHIGSSFYGFPQLVCDTQRQGIQSDINFSHGLGRSLQRQINDYLLSQQILPQTRVSCCQRTDSWEDGSLFYNHDLYIDVALPDGDYADKLLRDFPDIIVFETCQNNPDWVEKTLWKNVDVTPTPNQEVWSGFLQYGLPMRNNPWLSYGHD